MSLTPIAERVHAVRPGRPQGPQLRVLPILGPSRNQPDFRLLDADTLPFVLVTEVSDAGSVPELTVSNPVDQRVFLMDGQELVGAKQNRILNADVLVPAATTLRIPVSCVEQGRWRPISGSFSPGKSASHSTRRAKMRRDKESLERTGTHDADQHAVWDEVGAVMARHAVASPTAALSDVYAKQCEQLATFRCTLELPSDAVGVAVFHGRAFQGLDLFDRHATLKYFWESLVDSYAIEWLGIPAEAAAGDATSSEDPGEAERRAAAQALERAASGEWKEFPSPGEGRDWRLEDDQLAGAALVFEDSPIHLQLFPKEPATEPPREGDAEVRRPRIRRRWGER
jgi:hypothetical protein